ncbi:hypothetical protein REPUB_Repub06bG0066500 [Reevesia pubescens]
MEIEGRLKHKFSGNFPEFGAIFMSNASTREECFQRKLFGLPMSSADFVKGVKVGMILFLFEYEKRQLYGVFKATTDGELNIIPRAYISSGKKFPAQVRFTTIWRCHPLREHEFEKAIRDNYYATGRFNFGLSKDQVQRLLLLFDSRKIRPLLSRSSIDSEIRKRYRESSSEKREMKKDRSNSNHTRIARKKLKRDIDSISHSNGEPLAYSGKLTVSKDDSQLLDSGDSHIACKKSDSMHCNCSYCPESPCSQNSLAVVAGHSSTSGHEMGPYHHHANQSPPVSIGEELKKLETSGNLDIDLGDYIPLSPSDDSDSTDTRASPESGCFMTDQIGLPFSASGLFEDTCKPIFAASPITKIGDVHIKENAYSPKSPVENCEENENSDYIYQYTSVRGLYSDASDNRNVFSRLNFSSGVQNKEDDTIVKKSVHRTSKKKEFSTRVDQSAQEIMEELQQMHDKWKKKVRTTRFVERHNEDFVNQKANVFSRLSWTSEPDLQANDISTRWKERHDKLRSMRETRCPVPGGKKTSVFLRLGRPSEPDVHNNGISTLLQEKHDKQRKIGETEFPVSGKKYHLPYMVSSICLTSENEELGKSLAVTDWDGVASNSLQEVNENLTDSKGKSECYEADSGTDGEYAGSQIDWLNCNLQEIASVAYPTRTVQVKNLSDLAREREIHEFFSFSGDIEHIEIIGEPGQSKTAYVTFKDPKALEIALLLSGATIVDKIVTIISAENYIPKPEIHEARTADNIVSIIPAGHSAPIDEQGRTSPPGSGRMYVSRAQDVVANMLAKGSAMRQDAVNKAKAFDEKHQLTASASAKVISFDQRVGLTEKLTVGISVVNEKVKSVDRRLQVSDKTMAAIFAAERKINNTGSAVKSSRYITAGTAWLNGAFSKVAKAGQVAGTKTREKFNLARSNLSAKDPIAV